MPGFNLLLCFQRSYRKELFDDAISRMVKACIKTDTEIEQFRHLQEKVERLVLAQRQEEMDFGEIPDEFKGILIYTVLCLFHSVINISTETCTSSKMERPPYVLSLVCFK